ncbi:hypothetical protein [Krasilnikovia sp. MM14-A1004]|uniref:hypothetical protein n=1 Tax=Krasilnikovia sp. MM14-A1004 TaxID=3373541 RepID=UPI00399CD2F7
MSQPRLRVLSLGAGLQSSAIVLLAAGGEIAPFDVAVFADTGWEPHSVYRQLDRLTGIAAAAGMQVVHEVVLRPRTRRTPGDAPGCGPFTCPHPTEPVDPDPPEPADVGTAAAGREVA